MALELNGEMTIVRANELKGILVDYLPCTDSVELDLSNVAEMDTAGFQLIIALEKEAVKSGKAFKVIKASETVKNIFELYNIAGY
ncbi:MAG: STAS domain-containing protein [Nitrospirae bacterium]|nr:STAS domain-containing protein [Nitrospirota bacterium]